MSKLTQNLCIDSDSFYPIVAKKKKKINRLQQNKRVCELSKPKKRDEDEDYIGPGSYDPRDLFLSTRSKSPIIIIPKSSRFYASKLPPLKSSRNNSSIRLDNQDFPIRVISNSPSFSFKRTGHNLKLVDNPSFPGAGTYSPNEDFQDKGWSFTKAKKNFCWKKGNK